MSERERALQLLETVPDSKIAYVISYIQGLTMEEDDKPNEETIAAFKEGDKCQLEEQGNGLTIQMTCGTVWRREDA